MRSVRVATIVALIAGLARGHASAQWADNFDRPDGGLGANWTGVGGNFGTFTVSGKRGMHSPADGDSSKSSAVRFGAANALYENVTQTIDVFKNSGLDFVALGTGYGGTSNLFIKLQGNGASYDRIGFYTGLNDGGAWPGAAPVFTPLSAPFQSARFYEYFTDAGDTVNIAIDTDFDGKPDQTYSRSGVNSISAAFGSGLGIGALGTPRFDNWLVMPSRFPAADAVADVVVPFSNDVVTLHQVFRSALFPTPVRILQLRFSPSEAAMIDSNVSINIGYTLRFPGAPSPAGLGVPDAGGGGSPNAWGPLTSFFSHANFQQTFAEGSFNNYRLAFANPNGFVYFPQVGQLLMEINTAAHGGSTKFRIAQVLDAPVDSSMAYRSAQYGNTEARFNTIQVQMVAIPVTPSVLPTQDEQDGNQTPFHSGDSLMHQVYHEGTLAPMADGGTKLAIQGIGFAPREATTLDADVEVRLGYTGKAPALSEAAGGLSIPNPGGGGSPNANGPMRSFYSGHVTYSFGAASASNFQLVLHQTPMVYDSAAGHLLMETSVSGASTPGTAMSRASDSMESSSTARTATLGNVSSGPLRTKFFATPIIEAAYPNHMAADLLIVPFGPGNNVTQQVFTSSLFGTAPVRIDRIAYAPFADGLYSANNVSVRMGYTSREPNQAPSAGLDAPESLDGGGSPNASIGPMTVFRSGPYSNTFSGASSSNYQLALQGDVPFLYDPSRGNLLVEVVASGASTPATATVWSWTGADRDSSMALLSDTFASGPYPAFAPRVQLTYFTDLFPCASDVNGDGVVDLSDFFAFFNCFSASDRCAEQDGVEGIDLGDFFAFFNVWDGGC